GNERELPGQRRQRQGPRVPLQQLPQHPRELPVPDEDQADAIGSTGFESWRRESIAAAPLVGTVALRREGRRATGGATRMEPRATGIAPVSPDSRDAGL